MQTRGDAMTCKICLNSDSICTCKENYIQSCKDSINRIAELSTENHQLLCRVEELESDKIIKLYLCESEMLILKPNQRYIFKVDENCKRCKELEDAGK